MPFLKRALCFAGLLFSLSCVFAPTSVLAAAGEIQATMRTEAGEPFAQATVEVSCDATTYAVLGTTDDTGTVTGNPTTGTTCVDGSGLQFRVSSSTIATQVFPIIGYTLLPYYARVDYADPATAVSGSTNKFRIGLDTTSTYAMSVWNAAGDASVLPFPTGTADHTLTSPTLAFDWGNDTSPYPGINADDWFVEATKTAVFASGWYEFEIASDDGTIVTLDGTTVINDYFLQPVPARPYIKRLLVTGGAHTIDIKYYEHYGYTGLYFRFYPIDPPTAPVVEIGQPVTPVLNDRIQPSFGIHTDTAGTLSLSGGCTTTDPVSIGVGTSTVNMTTLADGTYGSCVATLTDPDTGYSTAVAIPSFVVAPPVVHHITTCAELADIATTSTNYAEDFTLDNDVDCTGVTVNPLTGSTAYIGVFDGGGYRITNLTINDRGGPFTGLFGRTSGATIKDLTVSGSGGITGVFYTGAIVGYAENTTLTNVVSTMSVTANPGAAGMGVGGLVGEARFTNGATTTWSGLEARGSVMGRGTEGGLVGRVTMTSGSTFMLSDAQISGSVQGRTPFSASTVGGAIGMMMMTGAARSSMENIGVSTMIAMRSGSTGGGLIGQLTLSGSSAMSLAINNASTTGSVTGQSNLGGFIGYASLSNSGTSLNLDITNSSAAVDVTGSAGSSIGGFIGRTALISSSDVWTAFTLDHDSASGIVLGGTNVGGFLGGMSGASVYLGSSGATGGLFIYNSTASGNVTGSYGAGGQPRAGGFVGYVSCRSSNPRQFSACTLRQNRATGVVSGYQYIGGFAGQVDGDVDIEDSYTTGDVTGSSDVGGFVGNLNSEYTYANISRVYASSTVTTSGGSPTNIGGLIGSAQTVNTNTNMDHVFSSTALVDGSGAATNMGWVIGNISGFTPAHIAYRPDAATTASCVGNQSGASYCAVNTSANAFLLATDDVISDWDVTTVWQLNGVVYPTLHTRSVVTYPAGASYGVSGITVTDNAATLNWTTDEHASTELWYGVGSPTTYTGRSDHPTRVTAHTAGAQGLTPCTTYTFILTSVDTYGVTSTSTQQTFRTGGCGGGSVGAGGGGSGGSIPSADPWPNTPTAPANTVVQPPIKSIAVQSPVVTTEVRSGSAFGGSGGGSNPAPTCQELVFTEDLVAGMTSPDVKKLQVFLNTQGAPIARTGPGSRGQESTYFGPATKRRLAGFQTANNLQADGALRASTRERIRNMTASGVCTAAARPLFPRDLHLGMRGADVRALQRFLNAYGFALATDPAEARTYETGYFGPSTQTGVKVFQKAHQLPQTGQADAATRTVLNTL